MATYEQLMDAARRADSAGDGQAARRFLELAAEARGQEGAAVNSATKNEADMSFTGRLYDNFVGSDDGVESFGEKLGTFLNKGGESATMGLIGDEASAAVESLLPGVDYVDRRDHYRQKEAQFDEQHPGWAMTADVGGALIPAFASAPLAIGRGLLGTVGRGAALGAGEGFIHGFTEGEGVADRIGDGAWGGSVGGVVGGAAPFAISGVKSVADPVWAALTKSPSKTKVSRALSETLRQSGRSADDVAKEVRDAALEGQGEFRLMDALGDAGQRRVSGLVRSGGDGASELAEYLEKRQLSQPERAAAFISDAYGFRGNSGSAAGTNIVPQGHTFIDTPADVLRRPVRSASGLLDDLTSARSTAANAAYDAARKNAAPVDVRRALGVIDDRIGGMQGSGVTGDGIDAKLLRYRNRLAAPESKLPEGEISRELSDINRVMGVKQAVQDDIGAAVRAGRNNEARELGKLVSALDDALQDASPSYRAANDGFREASRVIDAVNDGQRMAAKGNRAADTTAQFSAMTPDQQAAARVGYGDKLLAAVEGKDAPTANRVKPLGSMKVEAERGVMAIDPDLLARRIQRENAMWDMQHSALGGSRTADNQAAMRATDQTMDGILGSLENLGNIQGGTAIRKAISSTGAALRGENDATRKALAEALLSSDPDMVLSPALQREFEMGLLDALVAAGGRQYGREGLLDMIGN